MAKSALNKDLLREIKKTRNRFFSILMLVIIAVCFLFGLRMSAPDMEASMDAYLDQQELMDVRIMSTLGLTQSDVDAVSETEGTQRAEGAYTVDALASDSAGQGTITVKAISLSESGMNAPLVSEGRLPERRDECLVEENLLEMLGLELGDTIRLDTGTGAYQDALNTETFTIVGIGKSPLYISLSRGTSTLGSGNVSSIVLLPKSAFQMDYFTDLYVLVEGAASCNAYEDDYEALVDTYTKRLEEIQAGREEARTLEIRNEAQKEIDDAWAEYYDAEAEVNQELSDAWQALEDAGAELSDGWQEYSDGQTELEDARQQITDGQIALIDAGKQLMDGERDYADGYSQYQSGELAYQSGLNEYQSGYQQYQTALAEFQAAQKQYQAALEEYEAGKQAYDDGLAQYEAGEAAYAEGLAQYEEGEAAYAEGLAQYEAGEAEYAAGLAQYEVMEKLYNEVESAIAALQARLEELRNSGIEDETIVALLDELQARLDQLIEEMEQQGGLLDRWRSQLDEAKAQLDEGRAQLDEAKAELEASRALLDETKALLEESRAQLDASKTKLEESEKQLASAEAQLTAAEAELAGGEVQLAENGQKLDDAKSTLDESRSQLDDAKGELNSARSTLDSGWADYQSGQQELEDARQQVIDGEAKLSDAYTQLVDGQSEYEDGLSEYETGKAEAEAELSDARQELADAQKEVDGIDSAQWYLLDRSANAGFASYQQDAQRMDKLALVFPTVFFLVAALVCLTTMTRMVEEQRVQIGGLKALGYSKLDIARKYVGYGLVASLVGGLIGLVLGGIGIPWVIVTCWKVMYDYPGVTLTFSWPTALVCLLAAVACCTIAVFVAALTTLRSTPAELMHPKAPRPGKRVWLERIPFLWKRMSFSHKVTARNLFRYKKRFWMTVIGIAGCTGLMIAGFGLRDSIMDVIDLQYEQLSTYSAVLYTAGDLDGEETAELEQALAAENDLEQYTFCYMSSVTLESPAYSLSAHLVAVEQPEDLDGFWVFRDRVTKEPVTMQQEGALISEKTAELLGLSVGDSVTIVAGDDRGSVVVTGIVENYVQHYLYLTKDTYEKAFGERPENAQILLSYADTVDWEGMGSRLMELDTVSGITYLKETMDMVRNQLNGVYPAVIIIISAAAALAFVVLYNLSSINITERLRELATLRVLGFRDKEMRDYVFRENLILTLIGIALGIVMGKFFHGFLITTVEVEQAMFGRSAHLLSYVLSILLTLLFAFLVNLAAGRSLSKIDMVESLKTVE